MAPTLSSKTRAEAVAEHLRQEILSGQAPAGSRLRQIEVAERLGVSTTPVREAFTRLVKEGLLIGDTHKGVTVMRPDPAALVENYEIRIALEALAAEKAALEATPADIEDLRVILAEMHDLPPTKGERDEAAYYALNARFHARITDIADRPRLASLIATLREQSSVYVRIMTHTAASPEASEAQHRAIVEALDRGSPKAASKAVRDHLRYNLEFILAQIADPPADGDVA